MSGLLARLQGKLQEARISDVNHELGKVKESLVGESSAYWNSLRSEAAAVSSLIRSESTRFSRLWSISSRQTGRGGEDLQPAVPGVPKSVSLPSFSPGQASKYKYKSCVSGPGGGRGRENTRHRRRDGLDVVDKFIRVVETEEKLPSRPVRRSDNTREEIRKKLAFSGDEDDKSVRREAHGQERAANSDLQICFINEAVSEEDEEDDDAIEALREDSSEDEPGNSDVGVERRKEREGDGLKRRLARLQKEVQGNLQDCRQIAKSLIEKDKQRRLADDPLKNLVGLSYPELTADKLQSLNIAALQVIVNHIHTQIESLNEELVTLLIGKDELEIEQDSQLLDIEDLSHSLRRHDQDSASPV